jgi:hypothetical protein
MFARERLLKNNPPLGFVDELAHTFWRLRPECSRAEEKIDRQLSSLGWHDSLCFIRFWLFILHTR